MCCCMCTSSSQDAIDLKRQLAESITPDQLCLCKECINLRKPEDDVCWVMHHACSKMHDMNGSSQRRISTLHFHKPPAPPVPRTVQHTFRVVSSHWVVELAALPKVAAPRAHKVRAIRRPPEHGVATFIETQRWKLSLVLLRCLCVTGWLL